MTTWSSKMTVRSSEDDFSIYPRWPIDRNIDLIWPHDVVLDSKNQEKMDNKSDDFFTLRTQDLPQIILAKLFDFFTLS